MRYLQMRPLRVTFLTLLLPLLFGPSTNAAEKTSGQNGWVFRYRPDLSRLPEGAEKYIRKAHGGFAVDRQGSGDVYFHLEGYGIIHMDPDLSEIELLDGDPGFIEGHGHNTTIAYANDGAPYLVIPDSKRGVVRFADTKGKLLYELEKPDLLEWFSRNQYKPTDTLIIGDKLLVADGYGSGFIFPAKPFGEYVHGVFGGKGLFTTSHGLDWDPVGKRIAIADREASLIRYFTKAGLEMKEGKTPIVTTLPKGARPCDLDYMPDGTAIVGCLKGAGGGPGEVYILDPEGEVLSVIKPKTELGLDSGSTNIAHVHNASWTKVGDKLYLLLYAWNPGGFAVLERVEAENAP